MTPLHSSRTKRISYEPNTHFHTLLFTFLLSDALIHPWALQQWREELLPVFPPKWKELSTIITFFYQKLSLLHWHGQQWPCSFLWWLFHSSTALDAVTLWGMLWNVNWGGRLVALKHGGVLWEGEADFITQVSCVSVHCLSLKRGTMYCVYYVCVCIVNKNRFEMFFNFYPLH